MVIDIDIHEDVKALTDLLPYLPNAYHRHITDAGWRPENARPHRQLRFGGNARMDARPAAGGPAGSDRSLLRRHLKEDAAVDLGILTGAVGFDASGRVPAWRDFNNALTSAYNDWMFAEWIRKEPWLAGSIHVNAHDPQAAALEIDRLGSERGAAQVIIYIGDRPHGDPYYDAIYDAAVRHDLPVGFHHTSNTLTAFGYHNYYIEWHTLVPQAFMSEIVSLVCNGVFEKFPSLRVVMIEGGFTYVPHLMKRLDQQYRQLRNELPWITRLPSETIREHVRFSTQPMDEMTSNEFETFVQQMGSDKMLCFATDYPHWDFDAPTRAFPPGLRPDLAKRIFESNALELYPKLARAQSPSVG